MKDQNIPSFYLFIYRKIKDKLQGRIIIHQYELMEVLARNIPQVAKPVRFVILKELESYELIKKIDKQKTQIIGGNADLKLEKYTCSIFS